MIEHNANPRKSLRQSRHLGKPGWIGLDRHGQAQVAAQLPARKGARIIERTRIEGLGTSPGEKTQTAHAPLHPFIDPLGCIRLRDVHRTYGGESFWMLRDRI